MLDRLISGAGAVTDGADRSIRVLAIGSRGGFATTRPGSLAVAAILAILAAMLVLAGLEATDPPTPVPLAPADVAAGRDLGNRTYSTMRGSLSSAYVETYEDDNANGIEDEGEDTVEWYYWLVDPTARAGVTVRSTRPPEAVFTFRGTGILINEPRYTREAYPPYDDEARRAGLRIEPAIVLDTSTGLVGPLPPVDLAGPLPPTGSSVEVSGSRLGSYVGVCSQDPDLDRECDPDEENLYEILVFERVSRHAIRVLVRELPEFTEEATITGQLRREERAVDAARTAEGYDFGELDLVVSDRYILDDATAPGNAPLAFGLAAALVALAAVILVGLAGGYLIYRRSDARLPSPATTLLSGERIPLRITGVVRTPTGLQHVREAPGELIRFVLGRPVMTSGEPVAPTPEAEDAPAPAEPVAPPDPTRVPTTLIVERVGLPQGVAVGLGELTRLSSGRVMTLRSPRPAVRVVAGTGALFLSFDTEAERDRAAAELLDETGLGPDGKHIQTP